MKRSEKPVCYERIDLSIFCIKVTCEFMSKDILEALEDLKIGKEPLKKWKDQLEKSSNIFWVKEMKEDRKFIRTVNNELEKKGSVKMNTEEIEDLKEMLVCISDELTYLSNLCTSLNRKLEEDKLNALKLQNQLSIAQHLIPETEKEVNRLKCFIDGIENK